MSPAEKRACVVVADRHAIFRRGVVGILQEVRPQWDIRDADARDALEQQLMDGAPTILLLDLDLPGLDGTAGLARVLARYPDCAVAVLGDSEDRELVMRCLDAGALGYVSRAANPKQLLGAVETVRAGAVFAPASLAGRRATAPAVASAGHTAEILPAAPSFTHRQSEVLELLFEGCATKTIARRLDLAVGTVKVHLAAIYRELGVNGRLEALVRLREFDGLSERLVGAS